MFGKHLHALFHSLITLNAKGTKAVAKKMNAVAMSGMGNSTKALQGASLNKDCMQCET